MLQESRYPFVAVVGQEEMKDALILAAVNPRVQGVLLLGAKGTGKTSAVRGLVEILPTVNVSTCANGLGCRPEYLLTAPELVCASCRDRLAQGEEIATDMQQRLVELPLNVGVEDVVGGANRRLEVEQRRLRFEPGILSYANNNILYIDEINLLGSDVLNAIIDAAATGYTVVRRGLVVGSYPSRFTLVSSMNPEEGDLRPQLLDRIGLRVYVNPVATVEERLEVYRRFSAYQDNPEGFRASYAGQTALVQAAITQARSRLAQVKVGAAAGAAAIAVIQQLGIESHRTEIVLFEAARAYAALDERTEVSSSDVAAVAPLVLRRRRTAGPDYQAAQQREDVEIGAVVRAHTASLSKLQQRRKAKANQTHNGAQETEQ